MNSEPERVSPVMQLIGRMGSPKGADGEVCRQANEPIADLAQSRELPRPTLGTELASADAHAVRSSS